MQCDFIIDFLVTQTVWTWECILFDEGWGSLQHEKYVSKTGEEEKGELRRKEDKNGNESRLKCLE